MKKVDELFPYEYQGGGYFREKGIAKGKSAKILHGQEAVKFLYEAMQKEVEEGEQMNKMEELREYVGKYAVRGDCTCGKCIDAPAEPKQPTGHTANMVFFTVAAAEGADAAKLKELLAASFVGDFCNMDLLDKKEHNYMEIGAWIGDQGLALMLMGLGTVLGLWNLMTPITMLKMGNDDPLCQQMAGMGMVMIQAK